MSRGLDELDQRRGRDHPLIEPVGIHQRGRDRPPVEPVEI